jgi:hypothetical protein
MPQKGLLDILEAKAEKEPLGIDISDKCDDYCQGFIDGQVCALQALREELVGW